MQAHGYCDRYCYLPLDVFFGRHLLAAKLQPSNIDGSADTDAGAQDALLRRFRGSPAKR